MSDVLRLTTPRIEGPAVTRLQEYLDDLGLDCGEHDGVFGPKTEQAVRSAQQRLGLCVDGVCGNDTWNAVIAAVNDSKKAASASTTEIEQDVIDRRGLHPRPRLYGTYRDWSSVCGVTLHQTGCRMSSRPEGWDRLNAHIGILSNGIAVVENDPTDMIWHAQGLSENTIGIEICGNYCGIEGDSRTLWPGGGGPDVLNPAMLRALENIFKWLLGEFEKNHRRWERVHAHRQSYDTRRADPGGEIWRQVAIPWMQRLQATDGGPSWKLGRGRPIPKEWNSEYDSVRY